MEQMKFDLSEVKYGKYCDKCHLNYKDCGGPSCACCEFYIEREEGEDEYGEELGFHSWCTFHLFATAPEQGVCKQFR